MISIHILYLNQPTNHWPSPDANFMGRSAMFYQFFYCILLSRFVALFSLWSCLCNVHYSYHHHHHHHHQFQPTLYLYGLHLTAFDSYSDFLSIQYLDLFCIRRCSRCFFCCCGLHPSLCCSVGCWWVGWLLVVNGEC